VNLDFYVIQYVDNLICRKPRNIGVIAHHEGEVDFRLIGTDAESRVVDTSLFAAMGERARLNAWVFVEWAHWFFRLADGEGKDPFAFKRWMTRMEVMGHHIRAHYGGARKLDRNVAIGKHLDTLFNELVIVPKVRRSRTFEDSISEFLTVTNLRDRLRLEENVLIEFLSGQSRPPSIITLPFVVDRKPRFVFQTVNTGMRLTNLSKTVTEVVNTFQEVVGHGYAAKGCCIVLTGKTRASCADILSPLYRFAHVIDVTQPDADEKLSRIILSGTAAKYSQNVEKLEVHQTVTIT
jgi:hypothetical protein